MACSPVRLIPPDAREPGPQPGLALSLSGGGYRAMLFHVGALWRLNEAGLLARLSRISSVSGGSITAGVLGLHWAQLAFDANSVAQQFGPQLVAPLRALASRTIDIPAVLAGLMLPGSAANWLARAYRRHLFGDATLQDLPGEPRFVINATNVQSGVLWRFSQPYMGDYRVGLVPHPCVPLAVAVAASSAFPPVLSPLKLKLDSEDFTPGSGLDLQHEPYTAHAVLTDGGVYDNLGLETTWKRYQTVLVSDGGIKSAAQPRPPRDWARHAYRVLNVIYDQVGSLRKRQLIAAYQDPDDAHDGAYWGIGSQIADYHLGDALPAPAERTAELARTPTRLARLQPERQERLINWGYAICDAALRKHVDPSLARPDGFPYPATPV